MLLAGPSENDKFAPIKKAFYENLCLGQAIKGAHTFCAPLKVYSFIFFTNFKINIFTYFV